MSRLASKKSMKALREKLEPNDHDHIWQYVETVTHQDDDKCFHYVCKLVWCKGTLGIDMSGEHVTSHKENC